MSLCIRQRDEVLAPSRKYCSPNPILVGLSRVRSRHGSSLSRTEEEPQPTIPVRRQPVRKATQKAAATKPDNKTKAESSKPAWR